VRPIDLALVFPAQLGITHAYARCMPDSRARGEAARRARAEQVQRSGDHAIGQRQVAVAAIQVAISRTLEFRERDGHGAIAAQAVLIFKIAPAPCHAGGGDPVAADDRVKTRIGGRQAAREVRGPTQHGLPGPGTLRRPAGRVEQVERSVRPGGQQFM